MDVKMSRIYYGTQTLTNIVFYRFYVVNFKLKIVYLVSVFFTRIDERDFLENCVRFRLVQS